MQRLLLLEAGLHPPEQRDLLLARLSLAGARRADDGIEPLQPPLDDGEVGEDELQVQRLDVARRVDGAVGMRHGLVLEGAHDVDEGVRAVQGGLRLRSRPFAAAGGAPGESAGDVGELDVGVDGFLRPEERRKLVHPLVRHFDRADVHFRLAAIAADRRAAVGQRVENGGFARAGKSDDCQFHAKSRSAIGERSDGIVARASNARLGSSNRGLLRRRRRPWFRAS